MSILSLVEPTLTDHYIHGIVDIDVTNHVLLGRYNIYINDLCSMTREEVLCLSILARLPVVRTEGKVENQALTVC